ncbi:MAG: phage terminase family protein [Gordonia sp. (in: high G+C Gram-positive bacteria)]|jgi:hypothetical protein|nr:phage terminase family protein [Gordonia sp. (in: high G+C Gram-positive bacteria)]
MTSSPTKFPNLTGRQEPHHKSETTEGDDTLGHKAIKIATRLKAIPMPWQVWALLAILRTTAAGDWVHPDVVLIVPRQNGKTLILTIRLLFGLFVLHERIIFCSQRWPTAEDAYKRVEALIDRGGASLQKRVKRKTCSQGQGRIQLHSGAEVVFVTRSNDIGRGFDKVDLVIYDEAYNLTEGHTGALAYTQLAAERPQSIYASSAVNADQHPNGYVLAGLRRKGLDLVEGLLFGEWMAPESMPADEEPTWQYANPSYGVIHSAAKIMKLLRAATTAAGKKSFGVEALGRGDWPVDEDDRDPIVPDDVWSNMKNLSPTLHGPICVGVARGPKQGRWAIGAAQRTTDGRKHVEIGLFSTVSLDEAVAFLKALVDKWDPGALVVDPRSPAGAIIPRLKEKGIEPESATTAQAAAWAGGFLEDALSERLSHTNQPSLTGGVAIVSKRELSQGDFVWERSDDGSAAPVEAATLATGGLVTFCPVIDRQRALPSTGSDEPVANHSSGLDLLAAAF